MSLGGKVRRFLPLSLLAAGALYLGATQPVKQLLPQGMSAEQQSEKRRRLATGFAAGSAVALGALIAAHAAKRVKGKAQTPLQPAAEHPAATGMTVAAWAGIPLAMLADSPQQLQYAALPAAWLGLAGYVGAAISGKLRPPYPVHFMRHVGTMLRLAGTSAPERRQPLLESMRSYWARPEHIDLDIVDCLFAQGKVDDACALFAKTIPQLEELAQSSRFERGIVLPLAEEYVVRSASPHRLEQVYQKLRSRDLEGALSALDDFVYVDKSPTRFAVRATVAQTIADVWPSLRGAFSGTEESADSLEDRAQHEWFCTVRAILAVPGRERDFTPLGESRNEVLRYAATEYLSGLLVFKRCDVADGGRLRNERAAMLCLREAYGERIVPSLAYVEHEGKAYHVTKHATGTTLEQVLTSGTHDARMASIAGAADLLARIHRHTPQGYSVPATGAHYYHDRLHKTFCDELKKAGVAVPVGVYAELEGVARLVYDGLRDAPIGFYKDANPRNWLVHNGKVAALDFEHNQLLPVQLDLVSLLEFGPSPTNVFERIEAFDAYFRARGIVDEAAQQEFKRQYAFAALQRHLEFVGYRARDKEGGAVLFHVNRAKACAEELGAKGFVASLSEIVMPL